MNTVTKNNHVQKLIIKRLIQVAIQFFMLAAILFLTSGQLDWIWAWVYLIIGLSGTLIATPIMLRTNPELIAERAEIKENTKGWDKTFSRYSIIVTLAMLVVAGLDQRFGWSEGFPRELHVIGLVLYAIGTALFFWSLVSNKYFSRSVRIQKERDHAVIHTGPYQHIRHPGYSGMIVSTLGTPLVLGSWWAIIPALLTAGGFVVRTLLEDQTLQAELDGYIKYARRVRFRLLPGVW
ncbi:isoprenylcysteine carboxylmethyltransferase family protein [Chloroflexota bacterium]